MTDCGKPVCIDLFCGLGGWSEGFLAEGYECVGYDIEAHSYGSGEYPGSLVLRDVRSIHGSEFKDAAVIVASPPCQAYSYRAMPWSRAKALPPPDNELFDACFRIQREASEAAGRHIPMIVENVRGAQKWVGRAKWHYGSFYLWGEVPALMPITLQMKAPGKNWNEWKAWDGTEENKPKSVRPWGDEVKVPSTEGRRTDCGDEAVKQGGAQSDWFSKQAARKVDEQGLKGGGDWFGSGADCSLQQRRFSGTRQAGISGPRENGKGDKWFQDGAARHGSQSNSRKAASAMIAKIPFPLAQHIARCFYPAQKRIELMEACMAERGSQ